MKKYLSFGIIGLILSVFLAFFIYSFGNRPGNMLISFNTSIIFSLLIYFLPLLLIGIFFDLSKKNKIFKILAIILLVLIILTTGFLILLSFSSRLVT